MQLWPLSRRALVATALVTVLAGILLTRPAPAPRRAATPPGAAHEAVATHVTRTAAVHVARVHRRPAAPDDERTPADAVDTDDDAPRARIVGDDDVPADVVPMPPALMLSSLVHGAARLPAATHTVAAGGGSLDDARDDHDRRAARMKRRRLARQRAGRAAQGRPADASSPSSPASASVPSTPTTFVPPPVATTPGTSNPTGITVSTGDGVQFPTDGQVSIPLHQPPSAGAGSVGVWVQPGWEPGNRDDATLVQLGDQLRVAKQGDGLRLDAAGHAPDDHPDAPAVDTSIDDWSPGEWHHVTATWNGNVVSLYVDGQLAGRHVGQQALDVPADTAVVVGSDGDDDHRVARGLIGRVDVHDHALDDDEVAKHDRDAAPDAAHGHGDTSSPHGNANGHDDDASGRATSSGHGDDAKGHGNDGTSHGGGSNHGRGH